MDPVVNDVLKEMMQDEGLLRSDLLPHLTGEPLSQWSVIGLLL